LVEPDGVALGEQVVGVEVEGVEVPAALYPAPLRHGLHQLVKTLEQPVVPALAAHRELDALHDIPDVAHLVSEDVRPDY